MRKVQNNFCCITLSYIKIDSLLDSTKLSAILKTQETLFKSSAKQINNLEKCQIHLK